MIPMAHDPTHDKEIARKFKAGAPVKSLAQHYGLNRRTVYRILANLDVLQPRLKRIDEETAKEVLNLRLPPQRYSTQRVADLMGMQPFQVRYVLNRWKKGLLLPDFRPQARIKIAKPAVSPGPVMEAKIKKAVRAYFDEEEIKQLERIQKILESKE